jgi:hypothetical protein
MEQTEDLLKTETIKTKFYKFGAVAAFLAAFIFRRNLSAEADILLPIDNPVTTLQYFNLFHENRLIGLTMMSFFDLVNIALVGITFFTLYYVLKDINEICMRFANIICFIGVAVLFASNQAFAMLSLSDQYFAVSGADKVVFLTAGESLLAINIHGSGSFISLFLIGFSGLLVSIVMLQSSIFSKITAYFGILANGIGLSYFITIFIFPTIGWLPIPLSAIPLMVWYILIGVKLYKLSNEHNGSN